MLDSTLDQIDRLLYNHYTNWILLHSDVHAPEWATSFVSSCLVKLANDVQVFLMPCGEVFVSDADWNEGRICQMSQVPCMQFATRAIFYPMPHETTPQEDWKLGLLHEFAHLCPPNSKHDTAFTQQYYVFCDVFGLPHRFAHVRGFLI